MKKRGDSRVSIYIYIYIDYHKVRYIYIYEYYMHRSLESINPGTSDTFFCVSDEILTS